MKNGTSSLGMGNVRLYCAIFHCRRPLTDRDSVGNPAVIIGLQRVMAGASHRARTPQMLQQLFLQDAARLNEEALIDGLV